MSINMYVGEVRQQVQSINSSCQSTVATMEQIQQALSAIIIEPGLKGATYESMKNYFNTVYMPVTKGFILVCERMIEANQQFLNRYLDQVDVNSLQESVLEERIRQYNRLSEMLDSIVDPVGFNARMIDGLQDMRQETVRKLDALREYDYFSIQIFDELESQLATLEAGVTILSEGKAWNQSTGTFSTMGLNLDWAGDINNSWKDHQKKKDKDHEAKLLNELKNAKIYYANNNGKKVWYIMKDGKLVDAGRYSQLLDTKGESLVGKGYNIKEMKISKDIVLVPNRGVVGTTSSIFGGGFALRNAQDIGSTVIGASLLTEQLLSIQVSKTKEQENFEKTIKEGKPCEKHTEKKYSKESNALDPKGEPNSSADLLNPDGSVKQRRYYDEKGRVLEDIDYNHTDNGTHVFPHRHKWDWNRKPARQHESSY
ncbi:T7SS effector LXG polymorphic toxin [Carnobacterium maltaromaticum]|uniref:T7SS effector LXG polymorphic toxin n=1 Tax=Carnobacterium maltaromaticum TaxID=2751 RepID=UPI00295E60E4|nr:T7SS effector LXG polymorphic toxin [Carnobacterium maltaromaticum]